MQQQSQISLEVLAHRLKLIEAALQARGIIIDNVPKDDEGELTDEFKAELERRRKSTNYISHEEVKRRLLAKK